MVKLSGRYSNNIKVSTHSQEGFVNNILSLGGRIVKGENSLGDRRAVFHVFGEGGIGNSKTIDQYSVETTQLKRNKTVLDKVRNFFSLKYEVKQTFEHSFNADGSLKSSSMKVNNPDGTVSTNFREWNV